jgi:hypothetical protein
LLPPGFDFRHFAKPGNRENRTAPEPAGIVPRSGQEDLPGFLRGGFPPAGHHQAGDFSRKDATQ